MRRWSTTESVNNGEMSMLAIAETILAMTLMVYISIHFHTLRFMVISVLVAPFLLLRTPESTRYGLNWYEKAINSVEAIITKFDERIGNLPENTALSSVKKIVIGIAFMFAGCLIVIFAFFISIPIKLIATLASILSSPLHSIAAIPENWKRICFVVDCKFPPELVPGIEAEKHGEDHRYTLFSFIKFGNFIKAFRIDLTLTENLAKLTLLPVLPVYIMAFLYRYTLKSTSIIYLPLIWIIEEDYPKGESLIVKLKDITLSAFERVKRYYSWFVIVAFIVPLYFYMTAQNIIGAGRYANVFNYYFPVFEIDSWHLTRLAGAVITLAVYFMADKALIRMEHAGISEDDTVSSVIRWGWRIRKTCTFWTIGCGLYILYSTVEWSKVVFKTLPLQ